MQSTTLLLMAMNGEFETKPDHAIFADTQWEPKEVYRHLEWLESVSTIPIHKTTKGNIREDALSGNRCATMPVHILTVRKRGRLAGSIQHGMLRRQCTHEYKITPIEKKIRELMGIKRLSPKTPVELWMGISWDERLRMRDNRNRNIKNYYPLIEKRITRYDCMEWLKAHNYPIPSKSACIGCPFHDNKTWKVMIKNYPEVLEFDDKIRRLPRIKGEVYLHSSLKPLREIDFEDKQESFGFLNEYSGHCGV